MAGPSFRLGQPESVSDPEYRPEVTPEIVERVVHEIDAVVTGVRFAGWQSSREGDRTVKFEIRRAFTKYRLDPTGESSTLRTRTLAEDYRDIRWEIKRRVDEVPGDRLASFTAGA